MFLFERFEPLLEVNRLVDFVGKCICLERCKAWFNQVNTNYITEIRHKSMYTTLKVS